MTVQQTRSLMPKNGYSATLAEEYVEWCCRIQTAARRGQHSIVVDQGTSWNDNIFKLAQDGFSIRDLYWGRWEISW